MPYTLKILPDFSNWDKLVASFPGANIYQTEIFYGFLKEIYGWCQKFHFIVEEKKTKDTVAIALAFFKKRYSLIPSFLGTPEIIFGPLVKDSTQPSKTAIQMIIEKFDQRCQEGGFAFSAICPPPGSSSSSLLANGSPENKDAYHTFLVNLREDQEKIFSRLSSSWRRYVNKGYKELELYKIIDSSDPVLKKIYQIHKEKIRRLKGEKVQTEVLSFDHFKQTVKIFVERGFGQYTVGLYKGEVISSDCTIGFGDYGISWLADTSHKYPDVRASHFLRWEGILWSKKKGYSYYDFGQVAAGNEEEVPESARGIYIFKQRFGGNHAVAQRRIKEYSRQRKKLFEILLKPYLFVKNLNSDR